MKRKKYMDMKSIFYLSVTVANIASGFCWVKTGLIMLIFLRRAKMMSDG